MGVICGVKYKVIYKVIQGYLTGFVDLVFEYDGRFYIVDYKTNLLGEKMSDRGHGPKNGKIRPADPVDYFFMGPGKK